LIRFLPRPGIDPSCANRMILGQDRRHCVIWHCLNTALLIRSFSGLGDLVRLRSRMWQPRQGPRDRRDRQRKRKAVSAAPAVKRRGCRWGRADSLACLSSPPLEKKADACMGCSRGRGQGGPTPFQRKPALGRVVQILAGKGPLDFPVFYGLHSLASDLPNSHSTSRTATFAPGPAFFARPRQH